MESTVPCEPETSPDGSPASWPHIPDLRTSAAPSSIPPLNADGRIIVKAADLIRPSLSLPLVRSRSSNTGRLRPRFFESEGSRPRFPSRRVFTSLPDLIDERLDRRPGAPVIHRRQTRSNYLRSSREIDCRFVEADPQPSGWNPLVVFDLESPRPVNCSWNQRFQHTRPILGGP